jgi:hypothetical protein
MATPSSGPEPDGEPSQVVPQGRDASEHPEPTARHGGRAQATMAVVLLTGLWVALSPRFLPLESRGTNAAADVIIGLLVAGIAILALVSQRPGPRFTSLVLGVWVVLVSSFMLDKRISIAAPVYWSNTWSGAVLAVLALATLCPGWRGRRQAAARKFHYANHCTEPGSPTGHREVRSHQPTRRPT